MGQGKIGTSFASLQCRESELYCLQARYITEALLDKRIMFKRANQAGFTLIEVMIVVAIVGISVGLALPDFLRWHVQTQLREATSEIATKLTLARMAGMNRNRSVDVTVQVVGTAVHISAVVSSTGVVVVSDTSFPQNVTSVVGSPVTVSFSSMGTRTSGGTGVQRIGVCDKYARQYSVTITPSGKVNWSIDSSGTPCP